MTPQITATPTRKVDNLVEALGCDSRDLKLDATTPPPPTSQNNPAN